MATTEAAHTSVASESTDARVRNRGEDRADLVRVLAALALLALLASFDSAGAPPPAETAGNPL